MNGAGRPIEDALSIRLGSEIFYVHYGRADQHEMLPHFEKSIGDLVEVAHVQSIRVLSTILDDHDNTVIVNGNTDKPIIIPINQDRVNITSHGVYFDSKVKANAVATEANSRNLQTVNDLEEQLAKVKSLLKSTLELNQSEED